MYHLKHNQRTLVPWQSWLGAKFIGHSYSIPDSYIGIKLYEYSLSKPSIMSNGLPRESIGLGGIMMNVVPREVPRPKPSGPAAPQVLAFGPPKAQHSP